LADDVGTGVGVEVGMEAGTCVGVSIGVGVGGGRGVPVAVGSWTRIGVRVAVGSGVAVGGAVGVAVGGGVVGVAVGSGTVAVAVGGVVGMGVGVSVAGGLDVLVGVGVGTGEGLQPPRRGSRNSPPMTQRLRKTLVLEVVLTPIMFILTSGKGFRIAGHIIAHLLQLDHFCPPALSLESGLTIMLHQTKISNLSRSRF
jgi:hypothetical protein